MATPQIPSHLPFEERVLLAVWWRLVCEQETTARRVRMRLAFDLALKRAIADAEE
jgi:hypothetical protein